jgi:hypothetical protein
MKVSFDFDGTLERTDVQEYAAQLIKLGVEVWVVTTRYDSNHQHKWFKAYPEELWAKITSNTTGDPNAKLWAVVDRLGIPRYHVRFTCMEWKYTYLNGTKFLWHLDDNPEEFKHARNHDCNITMIQVESGSWKQKCEKLIELRLSEIEANKTEENQGTI